ncbi:uncharacterized protein K489DRAFT_381172 [Dissoconium aciculare CBS 342.82]|uniref:Uncharacterized protein n=1 Tax=Dissoconium aciculare CBS 342.82 TaxID=1314786 RepID=A0A6J3M3D7_9PEZI|nr:uncharacterized protein K489DRAFT_381172 [Dissoconium aciculare CBS 342.82]KAF1822413.1 hypothetical protein K489DRAFT_381172 [Dissoconium aciculare CBS 342.82]
MTSATLLLLATLLCSRATAQVLNGNAGQPGTSNATFGTPRLCEASAGAANVVSES